MSLTSPGGPGGAIPNQAYHCQCVITHRGTEQPTVVVLSQDTRLTGDSCDDQSLRFEDEQGTLLRQVCAPYDVLFESYARKTLDANKELRITFRHNPGTSKSRPPSLFLIRVYALKEGKTSLLNFNF